VLSSCWFTSLIKCPHESRDNDLASSQITDEAPNPTAHTAWVRLGLKGKGYGQGRGRKEPTHIFFLLCALLTIVGVGDALATTDDAAALVAAVVALVADAHERARAHVRVADDALAVALLAQAADRCASQPQSPLRQLQATG
jgi:hypothetical protein